MGTNHITALQSIYRSACWPHYSRASWSHLAARAAAPPVINAAAIIATALATTGTGSAPGGPATPATTTTATMMKGLTTAVGLKRHMTTTGLTTTFGWLDPVRTGRVLPTSIQQYELVYQRTELAGKFGEVGRIFFCKRFIATNSIPESEK